jgi:hypothetical protein
MAVEIRSTSPVELYRHKRLQQISAEVDKQIIEAEKLGEKEREFYALDSKFKIKYEPNLSDWLIYEVFEAKKKEVVECIERKKIEQVV